MHAALELRHRNTDASDFMVPPQPPAYAIETEALTKKFGQLTAVDNVSIKVGKGELFGLLGPNGAGKTTLISMLVTMKKPTSGLAMVNDLDVSKHASGVRKSIGIVFQDPSLDEELTAYENLEMHCAMYGVEKAEREKRINEVIEAVELKDRLKDVVKTFSGGMRRRLEIARGLLHYPSVLFLDEPTIGLDPQTRTHIWGYIKKLKEEHGITIVLTTHYLDEADNFCDRIAIIDYGKIIAMDTPAALKNSMGGDMIEVESTKTDELIEMAKELEWVKETKKSVEGKVLLRVELGEQKIPELMNLCSKAGIPIRSISLRKPTLDDVFMKYTGRVIRDEAASARDAMRVRRKAWGRGR